MPRVFVSYSWDGDEHRAWVGALATRLRGDGVETILDQWHVAPGDQLPAFMERAVRESDYVLIVCTPRYKDRSDRRAGGVGYEGDIMTGEVFTTRNERKFIPILRNAQWTPAAPSWLAGKYYVDLSGDPYAEHQYNDLLTTMLGTRPQAPPVRGSARPPGGSVPASSSRSMQSADSAASTAFEPIRIVAVVIDEIGTPRGDGTRGSALYTVPFRLSSRPPREWSELFVRSWDHPPRFTTLHRPGIASVRGDRIILEGTTVEEIENCHRETLLLATAEANRLYQEFDARRRAQEERERQRIEAHQRSVIDAAQRLNFDQ